MAGVAPLIFDSKWIKELKEKPVFKTPEKVDELIVSISPSQDGRPWEFCVCYYDTESQKKVIVSVSSEIVGTAPGSIQLHFWQYILNLRALHPSFATIPIIVGTDNAFKWIDDIASTLDKLSAGPEDFFSPEERKTFSNVSILKENPDNRPGVPFTHITKMNAIQYSQYLLKYGQVQFSEHMGVMHESSKEHFLTDLEDFTSTNQIDEIICWCMNYSYYYTYALAPLTSGKKFTDRVRLLHKV